MIFPDSESFCVNLFLKQTTHSILNGLFFVANILLEAKWNRIKLRKILHNLPIIPHLLAHLAGPIKLRQVASRKGNRNDFHSGGKSSLHSQRRVFEHDTMLWRNPCDRSGFQEDVRSGLSVFNIFSCHDRLEAVAMFKEEASQRLRSSQLLERGSSFLHPFDVSVCLYNEASTQNEQSPRDQSSRPILLCPSSIEPITPLAFHKSNCDSRYIKKRPNLHTIRSLLLQASRTP